MQIPVILFDTEQNHTNLLPLSYTRSIADFRLGIDTLKDKWNSVFQTECKLYPVEYLRGHYGEECAQGSELDCALWISSNVVPDNLLVSKLKSLDKREIVIDDDGDVVAFKGNLSELQNYISSGEEEEGGYNVSRHTVKKLKYVFDLFLQNGEALVDDFKRLTAGRESQPLSESNRVIGDYLMDDGTPALFIEDGAEIDGAIINLKDGPVYIGKDAKVMEGSCVRGPLALCNNAKIRMGAKIYGQTTIGPYCKVGGEIDNTVIFGYSNKAHDGYLGNAVIGEWCNIGAGVNASNLKNNYSKIRVWNYAKRSFMRTDLQFCGLIMGDHSKIGVNCMLNTATVLGVGVNLHGAGFPRVFVPSFSEGSPASGFRNTSMKEFHTIAERVMLRRDRKYDEATRSVYDVIYEKALQYKQ